MVVLEKIQNKYMNMTEFENGLTGFVPAQNEEGEYKRNEEGYLLGVYRTPEIKMLNDALFWMVKEGEEIKAEEESRSVNEVDRNKILRKVDIPPKDLGTLLHEEFQRCFERKTRRPRRGRSRRIRGIRTDQLCVDRIYGSPDRIWRERHKASLFWKVGRPIGGVQEDA